MANRPISSVSIRFLKETKSGSRLTTDKSLFSHLFLLCGAHLALRSVFCHTECYSGSSSIETCLFLNDKRHAFL